MEAPPRSGWAFFPTRGLAVDAQLSPSTSVEGFGTKGMSEMSVRRGTYGFMFYLGQDFLVGGGVNVIDSERCLLCLSLKPTLTSVLISSSFFASQMIRGTIGSTSISCLVPAEDKLVAKSCLVLAMEKHAEAKAGKDESARANTFLVG